MRYTLLTCALMVAISAFAEPGVPKAVKLQALDTDGDKMISLAEAEQGAPRLASRFTELDANNDGLLSREEIAGSHPMRGVHVVRNIEEDFAAADGNTDGRLSRAEAEEAMPIVSDFFDEMDESADGYVTMEEIHAHAKSHGPIVKHTTISRGPIDAEE
jgi:Ca2+-binding EF-hand superfamily protein